MSLYKCFIQSIVFFFGMNCNIHQAKKPFNITIFNEYNLSTYYLKEFNSTYLLYVTTINYKKREEVLLFKQKIRKNVVNSQIKNGINLDSLKDLYNKTNIQDGSRLVITIQNGQKTKIINNNNYYVPDIFKIITFFNNYLPKKYHINYVLNSDLHSLPYSKK